VKNYLINKKFSILLLIFLVGFLILPQIILADEFENISQEEIEKYLQLPSDKVENLIYSLINLFNSEWLNSFGYASDEENAVSMIMRKVVRIQALNHLLIDAPFEVMGKLIKNAIEIGRIFLTEDVSVLLEKLERESVQRAIEYGTKTLLQNEIRMTPGAIEFKYITRNKEIKTVIFQYLMIYQPIDAKSGKLVIRFYSPNFLEPPRNTGSYGMAVGIYTELEHNLPPFIVDIQGNTENYQWVGSPSIKITFPASVPDLGIRPLTFWEKNLLKPIENQIREIEVIITKITGKSPKIMETISNLPKIVKDVWNKAKSALSQFNPFGAEVGETFLFLPVSSPLTTDQQPEKGTKKLPEPENEEEIIPITEIPEEEETEKLEETKKVEQTPSPKINLSYPEDNPVNQDITITLSVSGLKNTEYDAKISIEKDGLLSDIYNEKEIKWQSSFYYLKEIFSGTSFEGKFRLRIREEKNNFRGQADILARIRESGKDKYFEFIDKINITEPKVQSNLSNPSSPSPPSEQPSQPEPELPPLAVVINEIGWMGTKASANDEWIELYNTTKNSIDLTGWKLISITDSSPNITLERTITPLGFYLLERTASSTTNVGEDQIYTGALKNNPDCEILSLYDQNNNLIDQTACLEDGKWPAGKASPDYITMERINPRILGSDSNNWTNNNGTIKNGRDADGNPINGTPRAPNSIYQSLPPNPISDFAIDLQNSPGNVAVLNWSAPEDFDTLSENLSYKIYYSKEGTISEDNLNASSTLNITVSTTTITISELSYNSIYYFGAKAFDGQNYSSLSNVVSFQTATIYTIDNGNLDFDIKNSGRKIVRTSDGNFYVVYVKDQKIFLAESEDKGKNWQKESVVPDSSFEQRNPSIAIDSNNNLHLVWQEKDDAGIFQIHYRKYNGSWQEIESLTANHEWNQEIPSIAVDSDDNTHIVWVNNLQRICTPHGDCYPSPQILYRAFVDNEWKAVEMTGNYREFIIYSLSLTPDSNDNLHLVWQAALRSGPSWYTGISYQKRTDAWGEIKQLGIDNLQGDQSSIAVDSNNNIHIVWQSVGSYCDLDRANYFFYIKYIKYNRDADSWSEIKKIAESCRYQVNTPSIAVNSNDYLNVIWRGTSMSGYNEIYQMKYSDRWEPVKILLSTTKQNYLKPNLLWSFYPIVAGKKTNQPKTGLSFIYYEDELKFYQSKDLTFE
jgi:hypothetical protein